MEFFPVQDYSKKWNISKRRIQILCKEGRIPGAKMIGNMWVIPENTERPIDARIKNPIVDSSEVESQVRKELKKLLRYLYDSCEKKGISYETQKDYVLSIIAVELCSFYIGKPLDKKTQNKICRDITDEYKSIKHENEDLVTVRKFIEDNKNDTELDNILSWAYQYSNRIIRENFFCKTQFFTEKYMINYLIRNIKDMNNSFKILDPCVGGGNFLVECLEYFCDNSVKISTDLLKEFNSRLYGYDIDKRIVRIALVNIRLRTLSILKKNQIFFDISIWNEITPNLYVSVENDLVEGSLSKQDNKLSSVLNGKTKNKSEVFNKSDIVITNPPFETIKGMNQEEKKFLKQEYPKSNCDTCVAFIESINKMLSDNGICGIVSQSSWLYLKSFASFRDWIVNNYTIEKIVNLGSGAFRDLSGEKSNVSLLILRKTITKKNYNIKILNAFGGTFDEKRKIVENESGYIDKKINEINRENGFDFSERNILNELQGKTDIYRDIAVPMQGTSTGNAKELVGFFWQHFGDNEWISVSNGGGYCRWKGLNNSVVKWGTEGEYIKAQKGSALRNVKYFPDTQLVFSDTGTAGLNVRMLNDNQIFIASGPGIRIKKGNEYAHLALLNSRFASYCLRLLSPKFTIAAGYIGQIPVNEKIFSSIVLEKNARLCVELKEKILSIRANNIEYSDLYFPKLPHDIKKAAWMLFNEDLTHELIKLEVESKIDSCLIDYFELSKEAISTLDESVGKCAYEIKGGEDIDLGKLDKYMDRLLDENCCLKRTKNSRNALGSDGCLEYISKDLSVNPEVIVRKIQEAPQNMKFVLDKYKNLILHNYVLYCMGYNTKNGVKYDNKDLKEILSDFNSYFEEYDFESWIKNRFNTIHFNLFKGKPYLKYFKGEICLYDSRVTE